ncbi:trypsin-1-like [Mytilus galloprovincialis]|uniref:Peptidase S1 domain-containing protein n=1 Tax=Mytilus galloprovincialis TaxID=29158 RepID=A0A8B6DTD5_MYTGA|nr:Hypothetical predicted protein [Mytilus galloprovincialis]
MKQLVFLFGTLAFAQGISIGTFLNCGNTTACGTQFYPPHTAPTGASSRIVGGREANPHSWPWMVLLRYRTSTLSCGGTLIRTCTDELVVITAAQCVEGSLAADWQIDVGVHSRSANELNQKAYQVSEIHVHENYSASYLLSDIALLRLSTPIEENADVTPICVTSLPIEDFYGKNCVVTGWGTTMESGSLADRLKEVYKPILPNSECLTNIGGAFNPDHMTCAGYLEGGKGACQGDQGGPLACFNSQGKYDLIGIVSWGFGCAREGFPAVYANVHKYLDWIATHASS